MTSYIVDNMAPSDTSTLNGQTTNLQRCQLSLIICESHGIDTFLTLSQVWVINSLKIRCLKGIEPVAKFRPIRMLALIVISSTFYCTVTKLLIPEA